MAKPKAGGKVIVMGQAGAVVPAGSVLARDDATEFVTLEEAIVGESGDVTVDVEAKKGGPGGCTDGGWSLMFVGGGPEGIESEVLVGVDGLVASFPAGAVIVPSAQLAQLAPATVVQPEPSSAAAPRKVLVHFATQGPNFHAAPGEVDVQRGEDEIDAHVLLDGKRYTFDHLPRREASPIINYPCWEPAPA